MADEEIGVHLCESYRERLDALAAKRGITPNAMAAELARQELALRTRPKPVRGTVQPFRRRPE
jgi:uncharacterized protein involved in type VI secretion and phage assembly